MNLNNQFARKLELFFDDKVKCEVNNAEIIYNLDWQSSYVCNFEEKKMYYREKAYYDELPIIDDNYLEVEFLLTIF